MCKRFEFPPFYIDNALAPISLSALLIFFPNPIFWENFFDNICPMKYQISAKINSCSKVTSSFLEDQKCCFYKKYFYKQHQTEF